ncbi:MAG: GNAT family N-acetyltransferase [Bacteroidales bacterium]|nr:GNAT family N-acetyltransferase [Bacteroidales bacterium]
MKKDNTIKAHPSWLADELELRCLTPEDRATHEAMSEVIYEALPSKKWLIPMTEEEYDDTYSDENEDVVYGIFEGERLVATSSLLHDVRAYAVNLELEEVLKHPCIEIGESMVLPEYRGNGLMLRLNTLIKEEAKRQGIRYMLATAHPDNIASNTSLQHLGYKIIKEFTRAGKRRNLLVLDLKEE